MSAFDIPPVVAIDSMTLVWGLRETGSEDQRVRATWLLKQFTDNKTQVIVSAVALSEYLTAISADNHLAVLKVLEKRFLLRSLNAACAPVAARLFNVGSKLRVKGEAGGRAILRADALIIAAAKVHGAERLYTNDKNCRVLANAEFESFAHDLPEPPSGLFGPI